MAVEDLVFWPACVCLRPFLDHVKAAAAGGFTSMAIAAETVDQALQSGLSIGQVRRIAEDAGVPIRHFDTVTGWTPIRVPPWAVPEMRARFDVPIEKVLEICHALGITNLLAVAGYPPDTVPQERLVEGFANLCDSVADAGMWVDLEFMPVLGLPDLAAAWAIVGAAGRSNSGILIDTWHFSKSHSDGALLKSIPPRYLRSIQLSDGYVAQRGDNLFEDMIFSREFPGEGELPVLELLKTVAAGGNLKHVGSEVFSSRANAMSALEAGVHSGETTRAMLAQAGLETTVPASSHKS
jgi:sugar phosphate isomerase/epimerase